MIPTTRARRALPRAVAALAAAFYLAATIPHLSVFPPVGEDEPWIAAAPVTLATEGHLGNPLFTGYYGMERHHLQHMPVYPMLEAGVFKVFGIGVWQMRLLSVVFGLALLAAAYLVGVLIGGEWVAALAMVLLVVLRIADPAHGTGILLLDRARINRYDIAVPVFGLLALWFVLRIGTRDRSGGASASPLFTRELAGALGLALAGGLAGLSALSHLYGAFWLPVLMILGLGRSRDWRPLLLLTAGFAAAVLPWLAFIAMHWADYVGQMKPSGARFDVLNPAFYIANAVTTPGPISLRWAVNGIASLPPSRVGSWVMVAGLIAACVTVVVARARRSPHLTSAAIAFFAAAGLYLLMFVSLLAQKTMNYVIAVWPLGALAIAWTAVRMYAAAPKMMRLALLIVLVAVSVEGGRAIAASARAAAAISPYEFYTGQIARCIPPGSRVLGLQHYWMGLRQFDYRTWLLPSYMAEPGWYDEPLTLGAALERVAPDVVLIDPFMATFLSQNETPDRPRYQGAQDIRAFLARGEQVCRIRDHTYGTMLVYVMPGPSK